jgi:branched-chain amino acid transport system permease protein
MPEDKIAVEQPGVEASAKVQAARAELVTRGHARIIPNPAELLQRWLLLGLLLLAAATMPLWSPANYRDYLLNLAIFVMLTGLGGVSFNLLGGYAGQISFGHAAFFGISAYAFALLFQQAALNPFLAIFLAAGVSAAVCVPLGLILFRLRGAYFALSMLAFAEIVRLIAQEWTAVTNGAAGILFFSAFPDRAANYWLLLTMLVGSILATWLLVRSKPGAYFLAIREDEDAAEALGVNTTRYKLLAFMVSAFMMGLAGAFYAAYFAYLEPNVVFNSINFSLNVLIVTLIGGIGLLFGPLVGAAVVVLTNEVFVHVFGEGNVLMSGVLLILFMLFMPEGLVGRLQKEIDRGGLMWRRLRSERA